METNETRISSFFKMSAEERAYCSWVRVVLSCGIGGTICTLGLVANLVAYIVLNKGKDVAPLATFLLRSLAVTDNFFLITWMVNFSIKDLFRYIKYYSAAWRYIKLYSFPLVYVAQMATIWLTVLIAMTRFLAVCKPYISRRWCTLTNVKCVIIVLYVTVIFYNAPRFFEVELADRNGTTWFVDTWLGQNVSYVYVYREVLYYIFSFGLPLMLLIFLNCRLLIAYSGIRKKRRRIRGMSLCNQQDEANITLVMIVVIAVFVICQAPGRLAQMIWKYKFGSCRSFPFYVMEVATIMEVLNSSVNFIVYCVVRPVFRKNFIQLFRCQGSNIGNNNTENCEVNGEIKLCSIRSN